MSHERVFGRSFCTILRLQGLENTSRLECHWGNLKDFDRLKRLMTRQFHNPVKTEIKFIPHSEHAEGHSGSLWGVFLNRELTIVIAFGDHNTLTIMKVQLRQFNPETIESVYMISNCSWFVSYRSI